MKKTMVVVAVLAFAGTVFAQNPPDKAPDPAPKADETVARAPGPDPVRPRSPCPSRVRGRATSFLPSSCSNWAEANPTADEHSKIQPANSRTRSASTESMPA